MPAAARSSARKGRSPASGAETAADGRGAIDVHAHFFPKAFLHLLVEQGGAPGFDLDMADPEAPVLVRGAVRIVLDRTYWDLERRLERMDAQGVQVQALSLTAPMTHWAPPALGLRLARLYNDAMLAAHAAYPQRYVGCATLPLQDPALAAQELERVGGEPAIRGVYLPTHAGQRELGDAAYFPLYERCEALGKPLLLHPVAVIGAERLQPYYLNNLLGNPFDTAVAAAGLVFGGVLDRFPRLEVVLPHGGGALPILWGRLQHGQRVRPEAQQRAKLPFRDYLRRFHYDTITHSVEVLRYVLELVGADRILLGSDYCFDMGYEQPRDIVSQLDLSAADRARILHGNAARVLGL
jgi:aminocarboxymuconate-semialdehyde decarboxylase